MSGFLRCVFFYCGLWWGEHKLVPFFSQYLIEYWEVFGYVPRRATGIDLSGVVFRGRTVSWVFFCFFCCLGSGLDFWSRLVWTYVLYKEVKHSVRGLSFWSLLFDQISTSDWFLLGWVCFFSGALKVGHTYLVIVPLFYKLFITLRGVPATPSLVFVNFPCWLVLGLSFLVGLSVLNYFFSFLFVFTRAITRAPYKPFTGW